MKWSMRTTARFEPKCASAAMLFPLHMVHVSRSFPTTSAFNAVTTEQDLIFDCTAGVSQLYAEVCLLGRSVMRGSVCGVCACL